MTQEALTFEEPVTTRTYRDRLAVFFRQRPFEFIDGMVIAQIAGIYAWRSRISEARIELGLDIRNRQRRVGRRRVSEYAYFPYDPEKKDDKIAGAHEC